MSVDLFYDYIIKGSSEELARFVENHIENGYFRVESLGVEYPEDIDGRNPYDPQEIIDKGICEIKIHLLIVYRMHFENQHVEEDILNAMRELYPDLEITREFVG